MLAEHWGRARRAEKLPARSVSSAARLFVILNAASNCERSEESRRTSRVAARQAEPVPVLPFPV